MRTAKHEATATLTSKSQITIPVSVRRQLGIGPGDRVELVVEEGRALLRPLKGSFTDRMEGLGQAMWERAGGGDAWLEAERASWDES